MKNDFYEYLPTIYIIIGLILALMFENWGKYFASMFIVAGVFVFNMRIKHRTNHD